MKKYLLFSNILLIICFSSCHSVVCNKDTPEKSKEPVYYSVNFTADKGYSVPETIVLESGSKLNEEYLPNPYDSSFKFLGWFDQNDILVVPNEYIIKKDLELYAKWDFPDTMNIVFEKNGKKYLNYICKDIELKYEINIATDGHTILKGGKSGDLFDIHLKDFNSFEMQFFNKGTEWIAMIIARDPITQTEYVNYETTIIQESGKVHFNFPNELHKKSN